MPALDMQTLHVMEAARREIERLRAMVDDLAPRAHAYDTIAIQARLTTQHERGGGMMVDPLWELKRVIEDGMPKPGAHKASGDLTDKPTPQRRSRKRREPVLPK